MNKLLFLIGVSFLLKISDSVSQDWEAESVSISYTLPSHFKPVEFSWGNLQRDEKIVALKGQGVFNAINLANYDTIAVLHKVQNPMLHIGFKLVERRLSPDGFIDNARFLFATSFLPLYESRTRFVGKNFPLTRDTVVPDYDLRLREKQTVISISMAYAHYLGFGKRIRPYGGISAQLSVPVGRMRAIEDRYLLRVAIDPTDSTRYYSDYELFTRELSLARERGFVLGIAPFVSLEWSFTRYLEMYASASYSFNFTRFSYIDGPILLHPAVSFQLGTRIRIHPKVDRIYRI